MVFLLLVHVQSRASGIRGLLLSNVSFTGVSFADVLHKSQKFHRHHQHSVQSQRLLLDVGAGPFLLLQDESSVANGPEVFATSQLALSSTVPSRC